MKWPKRIWLVGHADIGDIWLSKNTPDDVRRLWEPSQRREYVLAPQPKRSKPARARNKKPTTTATPTRGRGWGRGRGRGETREKGDAMKTCEKCGVELDKTETFIGHTPERCRDRLAARLAEAEGGPEGGDPPKGSRLWRCERELESARQHARDLVVQNVAQGKDRAALRAELAECRAELEKHQLASEDIAEEGAIAALLSERECRLAAEARAARYRVALERIVKRAWGARDADEAIEFAQEMAHAALAETEKEKP